MSKLGIMALSRLHAAHPHVVFHNASVHSCCPGWCLSEMSATIAANNDTSYAKSAAQGADSCCWIALLPRDGGDPPEAPPSGCFVRPWQVITDKASTERWAEWTVWSGANGGEHYLDVEREEAGEAPGGIVVEESPRL